MHDEAARQLTRWARAIRASDHDAFAALYDATRDALLRYVWTLTHDEEAGYDILQEPSLYRIWNG